MAARIEIGNVDREQLFCCTKWWGDPDMPADMEYPTMMTPEGDYPLTFLCQIDCEEAAAFDTSGLMPKTGMLYFFAAVDEFLGYDSPVHIEAGEMPKGTVAVKYTKEVNFETFQSCVMTGEDGESLTEQALLVTLTETEEDAPGLRLYGKSDKEGYKSLLQVAFDPEHTLNIDIKESDLRFGNWKKAVGTLSVKA